MKHILTSSLALLITATGLHAGETYHKQLKEPMATVESSSYWALFGGMNVGQSGDFAETRNGFGRFANDLDSSDGWFAGFKIGREIGSGSTVQLALELEGLYLNTDAEARSRDNGFTLRSSGDIKAAALMVNVLAKFNPIGQLRPYIGVGAGAAHLWLEDTTTEVEFNGTRIARGRGSEAKDWTFAYQGIAGLDFQLNDRLAIFTEYKALVFHDAVGLEEYLNHLVGVGVRVKF